MLQKGVQAQQSALAHLFLLASDVISLLNVATSKNNIVIPSATLTRQRDVYLCLIHYSSKILSVAAAGFPLVQGSRCFQKKQVSVGLDIQAHKSCRNEALYCGLGNWSLFILMAYSNGSRMSMST